MPTISEGFLAKAAAMRNAPRGGMNPRQQVIRAVGPYVPPPPNHPPPPFNRALPRITPPPPIRGPRPPPPPPTHPPKDLHARVDAAGFFGTRDQPKQQDPVPTSSHGAKASPSQLAPRPEDDHVTVV